MSAHDRQSGGSSWFSSGPQERCRDGISVIQLVPHPSQLVMPPLDSANCGVIKSTIHIHNNRLTAAGTVLLRHVRTGAHSACCPRHACPSVCTPLRMCKRCSHWTDFLRFYLTEFYENLCRKSLCGCSGTQISGTLREYRHTGSTKPT
jgi:hypothetical protein